MSRARFEPDAGYVQKLRADPDFVAGKRRIASREVKPAVKAAAKTFRKTGHFDRSVEVVVIGTQVFVSSTDAFAHLIEWGSANNPPYAPFRTGVRAAGLRLDESRI